MTAALCGTNPMMEYLYLPIQWNSARAQNTDGLCLIGVLKFTLATISDRLVSVSCDRVDDRASLAFDSDGRVPEPVDSHVAEAEVMNQCQGIRTVCSSVPTPSTSISTTSPSESGPTPSGVPVAITSPGSKVR